MINWFDHILYHTRTQPETPAIVMQDRAVTYAMLGEAIARCARRLGALALAHDGNVVVLVANPIRHMVLCLALFRLGICSISLEHSQHGIRGLSAGVVLGDSDAFVAIGANHRFIEITDAWFNEEAPAVDLPAGFAGGDRICRMNLTSGSTGEPKLIRVTVEDFGRRLDTLKRFDWKRLLCLPGLASSWGFRMACGALAAGGTLCFANSPFQAIRMIELFSIEYVVAGTEQLLALTRVARTTGAQLSSLRIVEFGGSITSRALIEHATMHVCRNLLCHYGASETGPIAQAPAREILSRPGYIGHVLPGIEVRIVNRDDQPCAAGDVGLIRCRFDRRWEDAEPAAWTDLGDLGWMTAQGELFIIGRAADIDPVAVSTPRDISPAHEAEHLLRLEWDSDDAAAIAIPATDDGRALIRIATVTCPDADAGKLEAILGRRGIDCEVRLTPVAAIPRGANGKVNRAQLRTLLENSKGNSMGVAIG
jgi:acyl-coenzyme A synthetase/AMP-(fatty) acid ligase